MYNLSQEDEDTLLQKVLDLRPDRRGELFSSINPDLMTTAGRIQRLNKRIDHANFTVGLFACIAIGCLIAFVANSNVFIAMIGLLAVVVAGFAGHISNNATSEITQLTTDYMPDKIIDKKISELQVAHRMQTTKNVGEQALYKRLRLYLAFAYYCKQDASINIALGNAENVGVLANGLDKLQRLGMSNSDKYDDLEKRLTEALASLNDDLNKIIKPYISQIVMAIIKQDDIELLPDSIKAQFADQFADKLMDDTSETNDDD